LQPLDARYVAATVPSVSPMLPALAGETLHPRWFREPAPRGDRHVV
jgi:hypothetical protein